MTTHAHAQKPNDKSVLKPVDKTFLEKAKPGSRLFHFPRTGDAEASFEKSPSAEYTLYSVIEIPTEKDLTLVRAFDKKEVKKNFSREELTAGDWWYNPDFS